MISPNGSIEFIKQSSESSKTDLPTTDDLEVAGADDECCLTKVLPPNGFKFSKESFESAVGDVSDADVRVQLVAVEFKSFVRFLRSIEWSTNFFELRERCLLDVSVVPDIECDVFRSEFPRN